jgi:hypothetical protein
LVAVRYTAAQLSKLLWYTNIRHTLVHRARTDRPGVYINNL